MTPPQTRGQQPRRTNARAAAVHRLRQQVAQRGRSMFLAALFVAAGVYTALALGYPFGQVARPGPGFFPLLVGVALCVATVVGLVRHPHPPADSQLPVDEDQPEPDASHGSSAPHIAAFVLVLIAYIALLEAVGHIVASVTMLLATLTLSGGRPWWQRATFAVGFTAASYVVFDLLLNVPLPTAVQL